MLNELILSKINEYLPNEKFPDNYFGKWRYHNWECDIDTNIWSIHFGKYKITTDKDYKENLSNVKTFYFHIKENNSNISHRIKIDTNNITIVFDLIIKIIKKNEKLLELKSDIQKTISQINNDDDIILRKIKLSKL